MGRIRTALLFLAVIGLAAPLHAADAARTIEVVGTGKVLAVPDMAVVTLGVEEQAPTAGAATRAMSGNAQAVLDRLKGVGIAARDIQTSGLSLNPVYARSTKPGEAPTVTGFSASTTLTVRVRDLAGLGGVLDQVVSAGANRLHGISFDLSNREALMDEARKAAVADALRKARILAESANVTLGEILSITESPSGGGPVPMARAEALSMAPVPVAAGEEVVASTIQLKIAID